MFAALAKAAERCMGELGAQKLANRACAFGAADRSYASLFVEWASVAGWDLGNIMLQSLANMVWAFARRM